MSQSCSEWNGAQIRSSSAPCPVLLMGSPSTPLPVSSAPLVIGMPGLPKGNGSAITEDSEEEVDPELSASNWIVWRAKSSIGDVDSESESVIVAAEWLTWCSLLRTSNVSASIKLPSSESAPSSSESYGLVWWLLPATCGLTFISGHRSWVWR